MMSLYGHDDGVGFTTFRSRTQVPRSSARAIEPPPPGLRHSPPLKSSSASPSSTGPPTPQQQLLTPPGSSSSPTLRTLVAPRLPARNVPRTLHETCDLIAAFLRSERTLPLAIPLTDSLWCDFLDARESATHASGPLRHLRFTYDALTCTLITKCMPSPLHDAVQLFFDHRLKRLIIERRLSYVESTRFAIQSGTDIGRFKGDRAGSRKQPDLAVMPCGAAGVNDYFPLVAVEVGFSEGYEGLKRDMELWLVGSEGKVRVVVVICLEETPPYQSNRFLKDTDDGADGLDHVASENTQREDEADGETPDTEQQQIDRPAIDAEDDDDDASASSSQNTTAATTPPPPQPPLYGPHLHHGRVLVGQITGFIELWRLDPTTSLPVRMVHRNIFPDGAPPHSDDTFELTMLDLFGWPEYLPQGCAPDEAVVFELAEYRAVVAQAVECFAGLRLEKIERIKGKKRLEEREAADGDWRAGKRRKV